MKEQNTPKTKKAKKKLLIESFMVFLIIMAPFLFKAHEYLPKDPDASLNFLGMTIERNGFQTLEVYGWFLTMKIIPLYLLIIWFFTAKDWWYHIILIPICMYSFQIFEVFYADDNYIDTDNILWILPVCMVITPIVYFIRIKLYDKHVHGIDLDAMDAELKMLQERERLRMEKEERKTKKL
ncbi:hypothetical protein SB49_04545 [Sediminicola sp. YIK13]|uniref:hypothetical protein n=1 Tax=Sediminicola sp. YIK13 TaxID=1453352 RepID=UPI000720C642|nr:hypothetical protein [Sediminicola sp. YIK13]ALM07150.1 hypothetical protein SB49_04545 [Sediminicola sp. YIK13]